MTSSPSWLKPVVDFAPLAVFFVAYQTGGLPVATIALMVTTLLAVAVCYGITRKWALMPMVTAVVVGVFGGLTLWLHDDSFIKMKPTIIYALFAMAIGGGLLAGKPLLRAVVGDALQLDDAGWRRLSLRFALFFLGMALANEAVRRAVSTDLWVLWKVPGSIILTFAFSLLQTPLIRRHRLVPATE